LEIQAILDKHLKWLRSEEGGERADLCGADLRGADLRGVDLRGVDLRGVDLRDADLRGVDLRGVDLRDADLRDADLRGVDLRGVDLRDADLRGADLRGVDLRDANLCGVDLCDANLSQAKNLLDAVAYISAHFGHNEDGVIVYKTFNSQYFPPASWEIKPGSVIEEVVNPDRGTVCGSGINVAPLSWVKENYSGDIWQCLIRWPWLAGVVVPFGTDGKIRASKVELVKIVRKADR
jgi:hypothetical protein